MLILSLMATTTLSAQLTVTSSGTTLFGERNQYSPTSGTLVGNSDGLVPVDTLAAAVFLGKEEQNGGGYITFGAKKNRLRIGEAATTQLGSTGSGILELKGQYGFKALTDKGTVFNYTSRSTYPGTFAFSTAVSATSYLTTSDNRLKQDVKEIAGISDKLYKLEPVSYRLKPLVVISETIDETIKTDEQIKDSYQTRVQYGFIAQEVQKVFPNLVAEDDDGMLAVDYIGLIPVLVDAIQNQQKQIEYLNEIIENDGRLKKEGAKTAGEDLLVTEDGKAQLFQNIPNPFREVSVIKCFLPSNVNDANIYIYDLQGKQISEYKITDRGECNLTIEGNTLQPGMYIYALVADGKEIDSKRMIIQN